MILDVCKLCYVKAPLCLNLHLKEHSVECIGLC